MDATANPVVQETVSSSQTPGKLSDGNSDVLRKLSSRLTQNSKRSKTNNPEQEIELHHTPNKTSNPRQFGGHGLGQDEEKPIPIDPEDDFPEGGLRAWLVVLSAWLLLLPSFGFHVSIGILQDYWAQHQLSHMTARDVGWIPSVFAYLSLALGIWIGPLFDRYGPRWIALVGSVGYLVMVFLLAECKTFWQFLLCVGVLGGVTGAMLTTSSLAAVAHWFKVRRGLAQGIAMMGSSCGGLMIPLLLRSTLPKYGYAWSLRIVGFIFAFCFIIGNILIKGRIKPSHNAKKQAIISLSIFGDLRFSLFTISVFGFEVVLFGALGILPTYATLSTDFSPDTGFYLIALLNGVSCLGRVLPGYLADRIGRFNTLFIMIVFTLVFMLALWLPLGTSSLPALYAFAAFFGFGTGSWMALTPACVGQLCRADEFGRYYGSMYFVASLATLICIPITGELVETVGPAPMVGFLCAILGLSWAAFGFSRWACLDRRWTVWVKV
ncbi:major facilitator superfamily domain-containing protein [Dendryphion nanum]|uniref:Major facilitator superfamily domain-containing protein n=1 Tax=Dendryphion nanum TaxID=256645 RepID=A0A9P9IXP2_9PLEO|nr:major facilitator superfamily domain-containing protein [Dendryphion nanum]